MKCATLGHRCLVLLRRWWKCRIRGLHYFKFVEKKANGSRILKCARCPKTVITPPRQKIVEFRRSLNG